MGVLPCQVAVGGAVAAQCVDDSAPPWDRFRESDSRRHRQVAQQGHAAHRAVKPIVRPMLGFTSFGSARVTLQGIELMHMPEKGQMILAAEQSYSLAA